MREDRDVDGAHDLGGMHGFGPVPIDADRSVFDGSYLAVTRPSLKLAVACITPSTWATIS